ncbi:hypothetical protein Q8F55_002396 [Vanrija albida]|uniref:Uncharacterized protein n=1 Tax=Vanrija albida TaxID=181172 RepID=A0ABR3Q9V3_9TREE
MSRPPPHAPVAPGAAFAMSPDAAVSLAAEELWAHLRPTLGPMTAAQEQQGRDALIRRAVQDVAGGIVGAGPGPGLGAPLHPPRQPSTPGTDAWRAEGHILQQALAVAVWRALRASAGRDVAAAGDAGGLMRLRAARATARAGLLASGGGR